MGLRGVLKSANLIWGESTANLNKHALTDHFVGCVPYHSNLVLMRPYPLCDYLALQACAYRISVHERLPANFINCVTALEKGKSEKCFPGGYPVPARLTLRQQGRKGGGKCTPNVPWMAILAFASLYSILATYGARKAHTLALSDVLEQIRDSGYVVSRAGALGLSYG